MDKPEEESTSKQAVRLGLQEGGDVIIAVPDWHAKVVGAWNELYSSNSAQTLVPSRVQTALTNILSTKRTKQRTCNE